MKNKIPIKFAIQLIFTLLLSSVSYSQDFSKLDNWLDDNKSDLGGRAVLMIYKNGKITYSHTVNDMGWFQKRLVKKIAKNQKKEADLSDFTESSRLPIASCSKWLSAALVMTFVDEGKLSLSDSVGKFLAVLSQHGKGNITISQCLSHTTAIKALPLKESISEAQTFQTMDDAIENIASLPLEGEPGKVFHYSNAGLQIAGAVIEQISGKDFETLFAERIANPLEMKNTDFGKGKVALPAGGAFSTPTDYMNFLIMILNKGEFKGKRILSEKSISDMQNNRITTDVKVAYSPKEAGSAGYGFGEWVMDDSQVGNLSKNVSSPGLFGSFPWVENEKQYCAFLFSYNLKFRGRNDRYWDLIELVNEIVR